MAKAYSPLRLWKTANHGLDIRAKVQAGFFATQVLPTKNSWVARLTVSSAHHCFY